MMDIDTLTGGLFGEIRQLPALDIHTHLTVGKLSARGLHDIMLYHMVVSDLHSAGCPSGHRLTEYPGWPDKAEAHRRIKEAIPYMKLAQNTSCRWGMQIILKELYDWTEPIDESNWERLDAMIRERADDRTWQRDVMKKAKIDKLTTELARREDGSDDDIMHYSMEWAFFTRTQRDEYDTALYELERCWGQKPSNPLAHGASGRAASERIIRTLDDVHAAIDHYVKELAATEVLSMATHISTDIVFSQVSDAEMSAALTRRDQAGEAERDIYASYIHEAFLTALEPYGDRIVFQASFAAEPLPHETSSLAPQRAIAHLADAAARHPALRFVFMVSSRHANQTLCTMCREIPNMALAGYWWHNFFPGAMRQVMEERLDMLATNKQVGFFSDAYCIEWAYAKSVMVRNQLSQVLSQKIAQGQYTRDQAVQIASAMIYDTPQSLLGMTVE